METIHKNLANLLIIVFYSISGYDFQTTATNTKNVNRKWQLFSGTKTKSMHKRKADAFRWFHYLNNIHIVTMMMIACFFPVEMANRPFFHMLLPLTGWLFFFTLNNLVAHVQKAGNGHSKEGFFRIYGLCSLAGYNMQSRFLLMAMLTTSILCTFTIHVSLHLLSGFLFRWLMESQFRYLLNTSKQMFTEKNRVSFKIGAETL